MNRDYIFDEIYRTKVPDGMPSTKTVLKQVEFVLADVRARGGHLVKLIHDSSLGISQARLTEEIRRFLRAYKKEGRIVLMIPGKNLKMTDTMTRYLVEKCPQIELDADMEQGNDTITVVFF